MWREYAKNQSTVTLERIEITPFTVIVGNVLQERLSGYLTIIKPPVRKVLHWSQGELVLTTSAAPEDSLGTFLVRRGVVAAVEAAMMTSDDPTDAVARFHESGLLELSQRQTLLREWLATQFLPLFSLDEGTSAFTEASAIEPEKRVFLQSTSALLLEGVRSITNGLVLRRSLGDLQREIAPARDTRFRIDDLALTDPERRVAESLKERQSIEAFLKHFSGDSVTAAKVVIALMALGTFTTVAMDSETAAPEMNVDDMQRDLELLAAIGSSDQRSLRAVALSRQLSTLDHYQILDVARGASRADIIVAGEKMKQKYDPATFPPIVRESVMAISRRIDEAISTIKDALRRQTYDEMLKQRSGRAASDELQKRVTQRSIAEQNFRKARDLAAENDFYGAIILLKQAVNYEPNHTDAWFLLGQCQERNPKWQREAAETYQRVLSINPNHVDALLALGNLYEAQGLGARAQSCYEDIVKIAPDNVEAATRLKKFKKR